MRSRVYLLLTMVLVSALAVVHARNETRQRFVVLQQLQSERDALNVDWGRLLLEEGAWSQHRRVEQLARTQLGMRVPDPRQVAAVRLTDEESP